MTSDRKRQFGGQDDAFEPADRLNSAWQENRNSQYGINAILYSMKAESSLAAVSAKGVQKVTEELTCVRVSPVQETMKSVRERKTFGCNVAPVTPESTVISPVFQGDVNYIICDDASVQYCVKAKCECKTPENYNSLPIGICDYDELTSSFEKVTTRIPRCSHLGNHKLHTDGSTQNYCQFSKNIIRHSRSKQNVKHLLLTLILQACLYFAAGKDGPVIQPATYQPCMSARSSSRLIYERHPYNCSVFYMCHGPRSWPMACTQENTVFSVKHKVCVWKNSNFDDCLGNFANIKNSSLKKNNVRTLTENEENNRQVKVGSSLNEKSIHENDNQKNGNGLKKQTFQRLVKHVMENRDHTYTSSGIIKHRVSIPIYSGHSLFSVNQNRVNHKFETQEHVTGSGHDSWPLGTKNTTGKSRNGDIKLTLKPTNWQETDEKVNLVDSEKTEQIRHETMIGKNYFKEENYFDEEIDKENNHNRQETLNHAWIVDKTGWPRNGFHKNYVRTTTQTFITDELKKKNKHDSFDDAYNMDSTTRLPFNSEHSERISEISSDEHSTEPSYYIEYTEGTDERAISAEIEQTTQITKERNPERTIQSPSFDASPERANQFNSFYKYGKRMRSSNITEENMETTVLPSSNDENGAISTSSAIDFINPLSLEDEYIDTAPVPSRTGEDLDHSAGTRHGDGYPHHNRESGDKQESVDKRNAPMEDKNDETSRSVSGITRYDNSEETDSRENIRIRDTTNTVYEESSHEVEGETDSQEKVRIESTTSAVYEESSHEVEGETAKGFTDEAKRRGLFGQNQTLLSKDHHLQDTQDEGEETTLRTATYGHNFIEPFHLGKSWLTIPNQRQTAQETDRNTELQQSIPTDKQAVHLYYHQKKHSNNIRFQDRATEKRFQKQQDSNAIENSGKRKTIKRDGIIDEKPLSIGYNDVRKSNTDYSSLLRKKEQKNILHKSRSNWSYSDKQTKQKEDDKANRVWYVRNNGLSTQSTEEKNNNRILTPRLTQSTKIEFIDKSKLEQSKTHLTVHPWPQLTHKLHNKQTHKYGAISNLRLMETFLRMLNITVHRNDAQVKDVGTTNAPRLRSAGEDPISVSTIIPMQPLTTERPVQSSTHVVTNLPSWKPSESDLQVPDTQKDSILNRTIRKEKYGGQESKKNNGRFPKDSDPIRGKVTEETQTRSLLSPNDHVQRNLLNQRWPQQNQFQHSQRQHNQYQDYQHQQKHQQTPHKNDQYQQNQYQRNQYEQKQIQQKQNQLRLNQQNRYQQNQYQHKQNQQNQTQKNQHQHYQHQQHQYQHQQNRYQHKQNQHNQTQKNQHQQNQYQHNQYQQNQYQQNQFQHNRHHQNRYAHNQYEQRQLEQTHLVQLQNRTLNRILRKDIQQKQRKTHVKQNSAPQFWEGIADRPWFEKLLNKDEIDIGQKKQVANPNYKDDQRVPQLENVKRPGVHISDQRQNYNLDRFRKQHNPTFDRNGKYDLKYPKLEHSIRLDVNLKSVDKNVIDNDLKKNILLLQNEKLQKHKQILLDVRNKTSRKLHKIKMDQISNFYTENDLEHDYSGYEDTDLSFMAQPVPVDPLPRSTKTPTTTITTTTTITATTQTTTSGSEDRKPLPPSYDRHHVPDYRKELKERCGIMATPLIIGGRRSRRGQWPWQASLQIVSSTTPWHRCGGVLVHPRWVLTAAHCMEGSFYGEISNWRVVLADHNLETVSGNEMYRNIVRVISHPGYVRVSNFPNDVALLELDSPVDMTSGNVQTACMPDSNFPLVPGMKCWISGWGETRGTGGQENMMNEVSVDVLPHDQCKSMWGKVNIDVLDSQVCLGHGQTGACYGDSGGPLMCESEGRFYVAGVMSWLINNCSANNFPNVFTRLPDYTEWLYKELDYFEWMRYL